MSAVGVLTGTALKAALDRRRVKEADLRPAIYVGPAGKGQHYVRLLGSGTTIIVLSAVGSQTFAPNEVVLVGSYSGASRYVLLGASPPGAHGASSFPPSSAFFFAADAVAITGAFPVEVPAGATMDVDIFGFGFRTSEDSWEVVLLPSGEDLTPVAIDTSATILSVADLDAVAEGYTLAPGQVAVRLSLQVAADAVPGHGLTFRVRRSTAEFVAPNLVTVAIPEPPPEPDHVGFAQSYYGEDPVSAAEIWPYHGSFGLESPLAAVSPVGYTIENSPPSAPTCIRGSAFVGERSIVWRTGDVASGGFSENPQVLYVLNSADSVKTSWTPATGYGITAAVLSHGKRLWWVEYESSTHAQIGTGLPFATIRIHSAEADLSDVVTELTTELAVAGGIAHGAIIPRITESDFYFGWAVGVGDSPTYKDFRYPLAGGSLVDRTADWVTGHSGIGPGHLINRVEVGAYGVLAGEGNGCSYLIKGTVWHQANDRTPPVLAWPIAEAWPTYDAFPSFLCSIDYRAGSGVLVYYLGLGMAIRGAVTVGVDETPLELLSVYAPSGLSANPDGFFFWD